MKTIYARLRPKPRRRAWGRRQSRGRIKIRAGPTGSAAKRESGFKSACRPFGLARDEYVLVRSSTGVIRGGAAKSRRGLGHAAIRPILGGWALVRNINRALGVRFGFCLSWLQNKSMANS